MKSSVWWSMTVVWVLAGVLGCAATEEVEDEEQAVAMEPEDVQTSPEDVVASVGEVTQQEQVSQALSESIVDAEPSIDDFEPSGDEEILQTLGALGMLSTSDLCDDGPCRFCEVGSEASFEVQRRSVALRSCCEGEQRCLSQIYFGDDQTSLVFVGQAVEPVHFSPSADAVVVSPSISSDGDGELYSVAVDELRDSAQPVEEPTPLYTAADLRDRAAWSISATRIHRLEGLSARAVEEARGAGECDGDAVSLPRLFEISRDATPLSERLQIDFERWTEAGEWLLTSTSDDTGWTTMLIDPTTQCMERTAHHPGAAQVGVEVQIEEPLHFHKTSARRIAVGERGHEWTVIRGVLSAEEGAVDRFDDGLRLEASARTGGDRWLEESSVLAVARQVSASELDWWSRSGESLAELRRSELDAPRRYDDGHWHVPVTILVDAGGVEKLIVELFIP